MTSREQIEKIKRVFQANLEKNSPKYRRAVVRELDFLFRKYGSDGENGLNDFISAVDKYFDIPANVKSEIIKELKQSQSEIGELWNDYFSDNTELFNILSPNDFEKLQALHNVDFPQIKDDTKEIIVKETRRIVRSGAGYNELRSRLMKRSLGAGEASTLANTSLAQFDNAAMFEFAAQGGIDKFKYDGVLHTNSRPFCKEHLGETFTLKQIKKLDNGQGIPVQTSCGGYNCTHFWTPVITDAPKTKPVVKKKQKETSTAKGIPVSNALDVQTRGPLKKSIDHAISMIDEVHGDGNLKELPVVHTTTRRTQGSFAVNSVTRDAIRISISKSSTHKELTTIHEIGHFLDHSGIGISKQMSSISDPVMDNWKKAIEESASYKKLVEIKNRGYIDMTVYGEPHRFTGPNFRSYFDYLLTDEELWARSYAQYIATKTNDPVLRKQLEEIVSDTVDGHSHWTDKDFEPIKNEIDTLFNQIGWIK